jgi:hypothetical protein
MSQARLVPHSMGLMVLRTSGHVPHARRTMHTDDVDEKGSAARYARFQVGLLMRHCWHHPPLHAGWEVDPLYCCDATEPKPMDHVSRGR